MQGKGLLFRFLISAFGLVLVPALELAGQEPGSSARPTPELLP